jgi:hypothetical protein
MQGTWFYSETQWLAQDLSQDHSPCTLAYWHQPTFSSTFATLTGDSNEGTAAEAWWALLFQHHATLILNGHDHVYTRFAPMDPTGKADPRNGIREFIVGTGGESLDTLQNPLPSVVQAATDQYYGVMKLTLYGDGYGWDYESALRAPGSSAPPTYSDKGWGPCRGGSEDN